MKNKTKVTNSEKEINNKGRVDLDTQKHRVLDEEGNVIKRPFNWKKLIIVLIILSVIGASIFFVWGYTLGGMNYLKFKKITTKQYARVYSADNGDTNWVSDTHLWLDEQLYLSDEARTQLKDTAQKNYVYRNQFSNNYVVEASKKISNSHYHLSITDKNYDNNANDPGPNYSNVEWGVIFFETKKVGEKATITWVSDVYDADPPELPD